MLAHRNGDGASSQSCHSIGFARPASDGTVVDAASVGGVLLVSAAPRRAGIDVEHEPNDDTTTAAATIIVRERARKVKTCEANPMPDEVTDTWLVGVVAHDEALSSVRIHAGYLGAGPTSGRDHRLFVRICFGDADEPSFPDAETSTALIAREEALVAALGDDAVLVAVLTVPAFRDLILHTAVPERCRAVLEALDDDDIDVDISPDPSWSMYRALFTDAVPADADRRKIQDAFPPAGGDLTPPRRRVEHRFAFPSLAEADQAAAALRDAGVEVTFVPADGGETDARRFFVVETEALSQIDLARSRDALGGFAVSWGGEYLGWELDAPTATSDP